MRVSLQAGKVRQGLPGAQSCGVNRMGPLTSQEHLPGAAGEHGQLQAAPHLHSHAIKGTEVHCPERPAASTQAAGTVQMCPLREGGKTSASCAQCSFAPVATKEAWEELLDSQASGQGGMQGQRLTHGHREWHADVCAESQTQLDGQIDRERRPSGCTDRRAP